MEWKDCAARVRFRKVATFYRSKVNALHPRSQTRRLSEPLARSTQKQERKLQPLQGHLDTSARSEDTVQIQLSSRQGFVGSGGLLALGFGLKGNIMQSNKNKTAF